MMKLEPVLWAYLINATESTKIFEWRTYNVIFVLFIFMVNLIFRGEITTHTLLPKKPKGHFLANLRVTASAQDEIKNNKGHINLA